MLYPQAPPTSGAIFVPKFLLEELSSRRPAFSPAGREPALSEVDLARIGTGLATLSFRPSRSISDGEWRNLLLGKVPT